jgi:hypothetical protein
MDGRDDIPNCIHVAPVAYVIPNVFATNRQWNDSTQRFPLSVQCWVPVSYSMSIKSEHLLLGKLIITNSPVKRMAKRKYNRKRNMRVKPLPWPQYTFVIQLSSHIIKLNCS